MDRDRNNIDPAFDYDSGGHTYSKYRKPDTSIYMLILDALRTNIFSGEWD